ncbi:transketolase [Marispirochaeta aestuarii]|uniref:transketolase n=1 Tax=Marispirochaeta aestuarii TaxID=1963862 RepID=UPI0029C8A234|nr:transketolase [Marispirochaeta aestuarii]
MNTNGIPCVDTLRKTSSLLRKDVLEMIYDVKDGHPGPAYSAAEIITALYFGGVLNVRPDNPAWEYRDRFVLSKGHACPLLYAALMRRGFFSEKEKYSLRKINSRLQGHPDMVKTPGIDATTGPLGNGLAMGVGMAWALKHQKKKSRVFVLAGDGEMQEGIVWEALQVAAKYSLDNLYIFIDHNKRQSGGQVSEVSGILPLMEKFEAFRLWCREIDGHDFSEIFSALRDSEAEERPSVIICNTVKGKGIDYMEDDNSWHKRVPTEEEFLSGMRQLEETDQ